MAKGRLSIVKSRSPCLDDRAVSEIDLVDEARHPRADLDRFDRDEPARVLVPGRYVLADRMADEHG